MRLPQSSPGWPLVSERRRLARDPLADLLQPAGMSTDRERERGTARSSPCGPVGRARITVQVDAELAEQARDAVMWLHKIDVHTTISAIAEAGLGHELQRLADEHHDGKPFPPRSGPVPTGRPPKT